MTVEKTLAELVHIDSSSKDSNAEIINFLAARTVSMGLRVRLLPYADERGVEKVNMIAVAGTDAADVEVELAIVGHTDTVLKPTEQAVLLNFMASHSAKIILKSARGNQEATKYF